MLFHLEEIYSFERPDVPFRTSATQQYSRLAIIPQTDRASALHGVTKFWPGRGRDRPEKISSRLVRSTSKIWLLLCCSYQVDILW